MIELWLVDLDASVAALETAERDAPRLSSADRRRIAALKDARERKRRFAAHSALRILLERTGGPTLGRKAFSRSPTGKPFIADASLAFSLSHAESLALIGLSSTGDIGVDIEVARSVRIAPDRRRAIMVAAAGLAGQITAQHAPPSPGDAAFLDAWCRLEAYAKATGEGIGRTLTTLGLRGDPKSWSLADVGPAACRHAQRAGLRVASIDAPSGFHAALAWPMTIRRPRVQAFPGDAAGVRALLRTAPPR